MQAKLANRLRSWLPERVHEYLFRLSSQCVSDALKHRYAAGMSMWWSIDNLKRCGFSPASVIDVGACVGDWTKYVSTIWPAARFLMIEPQPNRHATLRSLCDRRIELEPVLVGSSPQSDVQFHTDDLGGSSVLEQYQNKQPSVCTLPMTTLDAVVSDHHLAGPMFLKADVQGYELEVLKGATRTLDDVEVVLLEVSTLPYNVGGPLFHEVVEFMSNRGFLVYDICSLFRRQSDEAVFQADLLFVRKNSRLRSDSKFFLVPDNVNGVPAASI